MKYPFSFHGWKIKVPGGYVDDHAEQREQCFDSYSTSVEKRALVSPRHSQ